MGSKAGWKDVMSFGGYSAQRKMARAQEQQAAQYAAAQEKVANAIENSNQVAPAAVKASVDNTQEVAESNAYAQQKRKRTIASTVHGQKSGSSLGGSSSLGG